MLYEKHFYLDKIDILAEFLLEKK